VVSEVLKEYIIIVKPLGFNSIYIIAMSIRERPKFRVGDVIENPRGEKYTVESIIHRNLRTGTELYYVLSCVRTGRESKEKVSIADRKYTLVK